MAIFGVRELLIRAGIKIPAGAVSYHTEREGNGPRQVVFSVQGDQGASIERVDITYEQHCILFQQGRAGSFGWELEKEH